MLEALLWLVVALPLNIRMQSRDVVLNSNMRRRGAGDIITFVLMLLRDATGRLSSVPTAMSPDGPSATSRD